MIRIEPLNHQDAMTAAQIHAVLLVAHVQEAALLNVRQMIPLGKTSEDIQRSAAYFLGARLGSRIVGALSLCPDDEPDQLRIDSLIVHPELQRQGIAGLLLTEALRRGSGITFSVATGERNAPALALYAKFGFVPYRRGTIGPEGLELVKLRATAP